jgi:hypothetical protein
MTDDYKQNCDSLRINHTPIINNVQYANIHRINNSSYEGKNRLDELKNENYTTISNLNPIDV